MSIVWNATCVSRLGRGVLIAGPSGSGKSSLALDLMAKGWQLVTDDWCVLESDATGRLIATAPFRLRGLIEIRGVGIQRVPVRLSAPVVMQVMLGEGGDRLPLPQRVDVAGVSLPLLNLPSHGGNLAECLAQALRDAPLLG
jgi:HPr kinase/phosphorylase